MRSTNPTQSMREQQDFLDLFVSLTFDDEAAQICGRIRAQLANQGTLIGPYDLQIAAIALTHNLTVITHNVREFSRVQDLKIEDWQAD
ncbi:putative nucleic acid-binding protein [Gloeocapsa sp. PCC 73106]|nr:putative nucleic acid-binding protein [Gloeocapsa sp. PCC 73106]